MKKIPPKIEAVYRQRREDQRLYKEALWQNYVEQHPELRELISEHSRLGLAMVQQRLLEQGSSIEEEVIAAGQDSKSLGERLSAVEAELNSFKEKAWQDARFYVCSHCHDTGLLGDELCSCAEAILNDLEEKAGISFTPPEEANFTNFDLDFFSDEKRPEWYGGRLSPREVALSWQKKLLELAENFPEQQTKLYIFGKTGTGKSFMASAMGHLIRRRGYRVVFLTAQDYLRLRGRLTVLEESYNPDKEELQQTRERVEAVEHADFLILDDLGSENMGNKQYNDLIALLNIRQNLPMSAMIITGNLTPQEISKRYDERIGSRLIGSFLQVLLDGPDLRLQKAIKRRESL